MLDSFKVKIEGLSSDGRGLGRSESGLVIFAEGALPGQEVLVQAESKHKNFVQGHVISVIRKSPDEIDPYCVHTHCGGCPWQTLKYEQQLFWKRQILLDALQRIGHLPIRVVEPLQLGGRYKTRWELSSNSELSGLFPMAGGKTVAGCGTEGAQASALKQEPANGAPSKPTWAMEMCRLEAPPFSEGWILPILQAPNIWGYRNKMEFAFSPDKQLGLRSRSSHQIIPITACKMQSQQAMHVLESIRRIVQTTDILPNMACRFLVIREYANQILAELIVGKMSYQVARELGQQIWRQCLNQISSFVISQRLQRTQIAYGEKTLYSAGEKELCISLGALALHINQTAFLQINTAGTDILYNAVGRLIQSLGKIQSVWDIYCGVGSISLYLLANGFLPEETKIVGIDTVSGAIDLAKKNATPWENVHFIQGDAAKITFSSLPDLVIVDPPRSGLAESLIQNLLQIKPKYLVYISCNPATLARDTAKLTSFFHIESVQPVDLFPQTPHIESISFFHK